MEIGFFYDGPITKNSKGDYYGIALNNHLFERYLQFADKIHICMRVYSSDKVEYMTKLCMDQMDVTKCVNLLSFTGLFKKGRAEKIINSVLVKCDRAIIRLPSRIGHIAIACCNKLNIPYLIELVGCPWDSFWNHSLKGKVVAIPFTIQTQKDIYHAPAVLYVTSRFLQQRYPTVGNNIGCSDVELLPIDNTILDKRIKKIREHRGKIIIGTIAALDVKFKGQQYIIAALGYLKKHGNVNYEYHLVGAGNEKYLRGVAKKYNVDDQVKFIGTLPHNQIFDWLDLIDIYVQPSKQEGLPRALVEAMSRGVPAFGAKTGGIPELLSKEMLFDNKRWRKVEDIVLIIQKLNTEKMIEEAKKNFVKAKEFNKEVLCEKRYNFYKKYLIMDRRG